MKSKFLLSILVSIISFSNAIIFAQPVEAQSTAQQCETGLRQAIENIKFGKNVQVEISEIPNEEIVAYHNYPRNSPIGIYISVSGPSAVAIMSSTQFMRAISTQIITSCSPIGMVTFVLSQTDDQATFGLVNGQIAAFDCVGWDLEGAYQEPQWGETYCF